MAVISGKRRRSAVLLISIALAIFAGMGLSLNLPPPEIDTTEGEAIINFRADRGAILFSGDCVDVSWQVEHIEAVYINHLPTVGEGERNVCVYAASRPTLNVTLQDGREIDYPLDIVILSINPLVNFAGLLAVVLLLSGFYLLVRQTLVFRWLKHITVPAILITVVTLVLIEFTFRTYIAYYGTQEEQAMYLWSRDEINAQDPLVKAMPYLTYIANPDHPEHNKLGYRGPEIELPKPDGVFRIVALGGSTTYSTGTTPENSYPALLQKFLREDYGYSQVEVINGGMSGYSSWENLINYAFRVHELEPDMIIIYAAVNDVVAREHGSPDCYRGYNALRGLNNGRGLWVEQNQPLSPIALYRFIAIKLGWMPNPLDLQSAFELPDVICGDDPEGTDLADRVEANAPVYFERNMRDLLLLAKGNGVIPVLSTWSYYVEADRPEHWIKAINEHNEITRRLADDLDVPLYDLAANLPVDDEFWEIDGVHLVAKGTEEQAREYAEFLDNSGLIPPPD